MKKRNRAWEMKGETNEEETKKYQEDSSDDSIGDIELEIM